MEVPGRGARGDGGARVSGGGWRYEPVSDFSAGLLSDEAMASYGADAIGRWLRDKLPRAVMDTEAHGRVSDASHMSAYEAVALCRLSGEPIPPTLVEWATDDMERMRLLGTEGDGDGD